MTTYYEGPGITQKQLENIFDNYFVLGAGYVPHQNHAAEFFSIYPPRISEFKGHEAEFLCIVSNTDFDHPYLKVHLKTGHAYLTEVFIENDPNLGSHLYGLDELVGPEKIHVIINKRVYSADTIDVENKLWIPPAFEPNLGRD